MSPSLTGFLKVPASRVASLAALVGFSFASGGLALGAVKPGLSGLKASPIDVEARPISAFHRGSSDRTVFGKLEWRGGLELSANAPTFGGYSELLLSPDGRHLLAVSDGGTWLKARIGYEGTRPRALEDAVLGPVMGRDGEPLKRTRDRDAEGLALAGGSLDAGEVLVSFEHNHRIVRYPVSKKGLGLPRETLAPPPGFNRAARDGLEALTVFSGGPNKGKLVAFGENAKRSNGRLAGWIWSGGAARPLEVVSRGGFSITAASSLKDGTLLLLERRFTFLEGVRMRLRRIAADAVKPGAVLDGEILLEADLGYEIDNMEGLAVHTGPGGETVLTILSDDNFNPLIQRTLLLQFALLDAPNS